MSYSNLGDGKNGEGIHPSRKREGRERKAVQMSRTEELRGRRPPPASRAAGIDQHHGRRRSRCRGRERPASGHIRHYPSTNASHAQAFQWAWMGNGAVAITTKTVNTGKTPTVCWACFKALYLYSLRLNPTRTQMVGTPMMFILQTREASRDVGGEGGFQMFPQEQSG